MCIRDRIVSEEELQTLGVSIPYYEVTAVVEVPFGAHPTACYPAYAYDRKHIALYASLAKQGAEVFQKEYVDVFVHSVANQEEYLHLVGNEEHFARLKAWNQDIEHWMEVFNR